MYLLDSNIFIEAKNHYYSFDFCPGFWEWLETFAEVNGILTINRVKKELTDGDDELSEWIKRLDSRFFLEENIEIQKYYRKVITYVVDAYSKQSEVNKFIAKADPWIIATAMCNSFTIVTHEDLAPANSFKVKIPNVCRKFGVQYIDTFELLRREKVTFGLI